MRDRNKLLIIGAVILGIPIVGFVSLIIITADPSQNIRNDFRVTVTLECGYGQPEAKPGTVHSYTLTDWPSTNCPVVQKPNDRYLGCFYYDTKPVKATIPMSAYVAKDLTKADCS